MQRLHSKITTFTDLCPPGRNLNIHVFATKECISPIMRRSQLHEGRGMRGGEETLLRRIRATCLLYAIQISKSFGILPQRTSTCYHRALNRH